MCKTINVNHYVQTISWAVFSLLFGRLPKSAQRDKSGGQERDLFIGADDVSFQHRREERPVLLLFNSNIASFFL